MKALILFGCTIFWLISVPSMADEVTSNAEGDTIVILDTAFRTQKSASQNWQARNLQANNLQNVGLETDQELIHQDWQTKAQEILINALSLTGIRYQYGGQTPQSGFDCSGFVRYVFGQAANISLPPSARAISQLGKTIKKEDLQPGDLVFFNTLKSAFSHVGIYVGNNQFIHAPRSGTSVRVENMQSNYWLKHYNGAQRLDQSLKPATQ